MKTQIVTLLAALTLPMSVFAQAKKPEPGTPTATAKPAATTAKPAAKDEEAKSTRPLPMNSRVDEIDAAAKTYTQITREGKKVKHFVTSKTEIHQGSSGAKFEDIKVGDMVAGSRIKKNADGTEYEVVKITKFGPKQPKTDEKK